MNDDAVGPRITTARVPAAILTSRERFLAFLERRFEHCDAAEEILQAAYLRTMEASGASPREETSVAWFYRLLRNALVDRRRRLGVDARALERLDSDPLDQPLRNAICQCIGGLIPTLRPEHREIVRRVDLDGSTVQAAAGAMGISPNNAHVRLHQARVALRKRLQSVCGACAEHAFTECTWRAQARQNPSPGDQ